MLTMVNVPSKLEPLVSVEGKDAVKLRPPWTDELLLDVVFDDETVDETEVEVPEDRVEEVECDEEDEEDEEVEWDEEVEEDECDAELVTVDERVEDVPEPEELNPAAKK